MLRCKKSSAFRGWSRLYRQSRKRALHLEPLETRTLLSVGVHIDGPEILDSTFGGVGSVIRDLSSGDEQLRGLAVQGDGKLVAIGYAENTTQHVKQLLVARLNVDGTLDTSFSGDGIASEGFFGGGATPSAVVIQSSGRIVVGGKITNPPEAIPPHDQYELALVGYTESGNLDGSFGTGGMVTLPVANSNNCTALALDGDKIVAAGSTLYDGNLSDFSLVRFNEDGSLDTGFGTGGVVTHPFKAAADNHATSVAVQQDGKIVVAGYAVNGADFDVAVARFNSDGTPDAGFGANGLITTPLGDGADDRAVGVALQGNLIVVTGTTGSAAQTDEHVMVLRYLSDGHLDPAFGVGGVIRSPVASPNGGGIGGGVAIAPDGAIVVTGTAEVAGAPALEAFLVGRLRPDGSAEVGFGSGGWLTQPINGQLRATSLALCGNEVYVGGQAWTPGVGTWQSAVSRWTKGPVSIHEGATFTGSGWFCDPMAISGWDPVVNYGDSADWTPLLVNADQTFALSHTYATRGPYTVTVNAMKGPAIEGSDMLTLFAQNVPPEAHPDVFTATPGVQLEVSALEGVLANDTDIGGQSLSVQVKSWPAGMLELLPDGSLRYTMPADWRGPDSFTYVAYDGEDYSNEATVWLMPPAGISVVPQALLVTSATQPATSFQVMLDRPPTGTVIIAVSSSDPSEGTVSPAVLTFTPENGMLPQTVTLTQATEETLDGRVVYQIELSATGSVDPGYQALAPQHLAAVNMDRSLTSAHYEFVNTAALGEITVVGGGGAVLAAAAGIPITLLGHSAVDVNFDGAKGAARDLSSNGRDEVLQQLTQMELAGTVRGGGPVNVRLASRPSWGQLEEQSQVLTGQLDLPPYAYGTATSSFEMFLEVDYMSGRLVNLEPAHFEALVHQTPAANNDTLNLVEPVNLVDASGTVVVQLTSLSVIFQAELSNLGGQKWEDTNANGVHDGTELGLNDWVIGLMQGATVVSAQVTHDIDVDGNGQIDPVTERGRYRFENLPPGAYQIVELGRAGWARTVPGVCPPLPPAFLGPSAHWLDMLPAGDETLGLYSFADLDWNLDGVADEVVTLEGGFDRTIPDGLSIHVQPVAGQPGDPTQVQTAVLGLSMAGLRNGQWLRLWAGDPMLVDPTNVLGLPGASTGTWVERTADPGWVDATLDIAFVLGISDDGPLPPDFTAAEFDKLHSAVPIQIACALDRLPIDGVLWDSAAKSPQGVDLLDAEGNIRGRLLRLRAAYAEFGTYGAGPAYSVVLTNAIRVDTLDFANLDLEPVAITGFDYGDAPLPYPEARHAVDGQTFLGMRLDTEQGTPATPEADDDGVRFLTPLVLGQPVQLTVLAASQNPLGGYLNGWFDFNADGDWTDPGEQIFTDYPLLPGANNLGFNVPDMASGGMATPGTYARFRFTPTPGSGSAPAGDALGGEVEDYRVAIDAPIVMVSSAGWTMAVAPTNFQGLCDPQGNVYPVGLIGWAPAGGTPLANQVGQQWYWYRVGETGPEHRLDELPLTNVQVTGNQITLDYGTLTDPFAASVSYILQGAANIQTAAIVTNHREILNLHWFNLTHLQLDRAFGGNVATLVGPGRLQQTSAVQTVVNFQAGVGAPNQQTVDTASTLLAQLQDGDPTSLAFGSSTAGPGDVAAAFQWDFSAWHQGDSFAMSNTGAGVFAEVQMPTPPPPADPPPPPNTLTFNIDVVDLKRRWFDPAIAQGYDYRENNLKFATVMLPTGYGDNHYLLYLPDGQGGFQLAGIPLDGGVEYKFTDATPDGVSSFRILGIETADNIDAADPLGFPSGITYVQTGTADLFMRAIPQAVYVDAYGPFTEEADLGGLPGIETGDKVTWQAGTPNAVSGLIFGATAFPSQAAANDYLTANQLTGLTSIVVAAPAEVHGYVFDDLDGDGTCDSGEPTLPGVTVQLLDAGGVVLWQSVTDTNGRYVFGGLGTGNYRLTAELPGPASTIVPVPLALQAGQFVVAETGLGGTPGNGQQEVVNANLKIGTIYVASIHGLKFNDLNCSGTLAVQANAIGQDFDGVAAPALPVNWSTAGDVAWVTTQQQRDTTPNAAFIPDCVVKTDNTLVAPAVTASGNLLRLTFRHNYHLETLRDGGVLEVSVDDGAYLDVLAAGGSFLAGGYTNPLDVSTNVLSGRQAWSGDSGGWVTTVLILPTSAGTHLRFRWRLGTDAAGGVNGGGWYVDSIRDLSVDKPLTAGVVIRLAGDANGDAVPELLETTTDVNGEFHFVNLFPGAYTISEVVPAHTRATTPAAVPLVLAAGQAWSAFAGQALTMRPVETETVVPGLRFGNNAVTSNCGVYDPALSTFFLKCDNCEGYADLSFGYGEPGWKPLAGDWDGDGCDTIGVFQPAASHFYLRNSNSTGTADIEFGYGNPADADHYALVMGDWNNDGVDTIGIYDKASATWFLRNTNTEGNADLAFGFGVPGSNWTPIVGDWNGDGLDTVGLYDPATGMFYLRNTATTGMADIAFAYGALNAGWSPLIGDWNGDGQESAGFYQPGPPSHFYLRNQFTDGMADVHFGLGYDGCLPIVGNWLGTAALPAAGAALTAVGAARMTDPAAAIDTAVAQPIVAAAIQRWSTFGVGLAPVQILVTDLPGNRLGQMLGTTLYLDRDAAGRGWFIDATPAGDEEFVGPAAGKQLSAVDARALDRIDLLTVVEHELGHLAGLPDLDAAAGSLMSGMLPSGLRRNMGPAEVDALFAELTGAPRAG